MGQECIDYAHTVVIDAKRLLGGFLEKMEKNHGTRMAGSTKGKKRGLGGSRKEPPVTPKISELGVTKKESSEAQFLNELAEQKPEEFEAVRTNQKTVTQAKREVRREAAVKRAVTMPEGWFGVIYADPPWAYGDSRVGEWVCPVAHVLLQGQSEDYERLLTTLAGYH